VDDNLASLVKQIDGIVKQNPGKTIGAHINILGEEFYGLKNCAAQFAKVHNISHVPLVVPLEFKNGPKSLDLNPAADTTVIIYQARLDRGIKASHAFRQGGLNAQTISEVIADIKDHLPQSTKP
jgi:hypothetical protein